MVNLQRGALWRHGPLKSERPQIGINTCAARSHTVTESRDRPALRAAALQHSARSSSSQLLAPPCVAAPAVPGDGRPLTRRERRVLWAGHALWRLGGLDQLPGAPRHAEVRLIRARRLDGGESSRGASADGAAD